LHRGYVKHWRKSEESEIARAPHLCYRLWWHILCKANWKEKLMSSRNGMGTWVAPGTLVTSMDTLSEGIAWEERGVERRANRKTIVVALNWFSDQGMLTVESNRFGTMIYINNWHAYANQSMPEVTDSIQPTGQPAGLPKQHQLDTTKESKEGVEGKRRRTKKQNNPHHEKIAFAPRVYLTENEHASLLEKHGPEPLAWMIEKLDAWKEGKGLNGKGRESDAGKIRSWVVTAWDDLQVKRSRTTGAKPCSDAQRDKYAHLDEPC